MKGSNCSDEMFSEMFAIEIFENDDSKYVQLEELLLKRDRLFREAGSYLTAFTQEFGDMINENFELKVECIKTKKAISYCRRRLNRGLPIDAVRMNAEIDKEMNLYYLQLDEMLTQTKAAKNAGNLSEYSLFQAKKIYRRLVKLIHPDINRKTEENDTLKKLWGRIEKAYQHTDVDELENLEVLVNNLLEKLGDGGFELNLDDLDKRIERLEDKINEIITSKPYIYGELLSDEDKKQAYRDELAAEHDDYEQYLEALKKTLDEMLSEGGTRIIWQMN